MTFFNGNEQLGVIMNNLTTIEYLAKGEAKHFSPVMSSEVILEIPNLIVTKVIPRTSTYTVSMRGHHGHDNEGRAPLICDFLKTSVLANMDSEVDASGIYPIELHDSYTYLPSAGDAKYKGALTFSKNMKHGHTILFPDPYQIAGYGGMLGVQDTIEFSKKQDIVLFAGTTTGSRNPMFNDRINACRWAVDKRPQYQFYITHVAQMSIEDVRSFAKTDAIFHAPISHVDHFQCKYIFNIRGNTCCWSRVPMILNSNSLMLNLSHEDGTWYYPVLQESVHYVNVNDMNSLTSVVEQCSNDPAFCHGIVKNAKTFVKNYCGQVHAAYYAKCLFEAMAHNK